LLLLRIVFGSKIQSKCQKVLLIPLQYNKTPVFGKKYKHIGLWLVGFAISYQPDSAGLAG